MLSESPSKSQMGCTVRSTRRVHSSRRLRHLIRILRQDGHEVLTAVRSTHAPRSASTARKTNGRVDPRRVTTTSGSRAPGAGPVMGSLRESHHHNPTIGARRTAAVAKRRMSRSRNAVAMGGVGDSSQDQETAPGKTTLRRGRHRSESTVGFPIYAGLVTPAALMSGLAEASTALAAHRARGAPSKATAPTARSSFELAVAIALARARNPCLCSQHISEDHDPHELHRDYCECHKPPTHLLC